MKSTRIEGRATVTALGSWMPLTGPQWEYPSVTFLFRGNTYVWRASSEQATRGLSVGDDIAILGFSKAPGQIARVRFPCGKE